MTENVYNIYAKYKTSEKTRSVVIVAASLDDAKDIFEKNYPHLEFLDIWRISR